MTHADLVERAARWLRVTKRCGVVLAEAHGAYERPDAIGWKRMGLYSVLVECKATRRDFKKDAAKPHRRPGSGMGQVRYYMAPRGIIKPHEVPDGWGLLEPGPRMRVVVRAFEPATIDPYILGREVPLLYSALWKVQNPAAGVQADIRALRKLGHDVEEFTRDGERFYRLHEPRRTDPTHDTVCACKTAQEAPTP